ncbi:putative RING-H2 finger protein ATL21A [Bidens hawaiensis]|uniref:putative RING-H2 finger protein ATL21A n=1 Tax=Bidens hawaiensis TaxID=980011 RepID=UPI00404A9A09
MEALNFFLHLLILHILPTSLASSYNCPVSFCGSNAYSIRFPFRVLDQQPDVCGYPGFNLECNKQGNMVLNLPNSGSFSVRTIDYRSQVIQIYDPSGCSASRRFSLDLSGSPFLGSPSRNYTLLSCQVEVTRSRYITVGCLTNSTYSTLATSSESFAIRMANRTACEIIGSIRSPISWYQDQEGLTSDLNMDISLTWDNPNCQECVEEGGTCGYTNTTMQDIACFVNSKKSNKKMTIALIIVCIALALPAIAASMAMIYYIFRDYRRVATWVARNATPNVTAVTPETAMVPHGGLVIGLDPLTIESYTKVALGESKRLPGHEDAACSICLSEYNVKETVRCIPECRHCFHADCIDEWLKLKGTCPVCRNSPSPARVDL